MAQEEELAGVQAREAAFWQQRAEGAGLQPPRAPDTWEASVLRAAEPLAGKRVLELGCGEGDLTLQLVGAGAAVTAIDVSAGMVELARRRLDEFIPGNDAALAVAPVESMPFPDESFDLIVGKWVLHHVDLPRALDELQRLLRPGGRAVFSETSGMNPLLQLSRWLIHRAKLGPLGTPDEHPLTRRDIRLIRSRFRSCEVTYPDFLMFWLIARNVWRLRWERPSRALWRLDKWLVRRAPFVAPLSFYMRVVFEK